MPGADRWSIFTTVILPGAMPSVVSGLRVALGLSWAYLVLGELTGVPDGLGAVIMDARMLGQVDIIIVGMISIALLMDEPFAALDALTRASMQNLLLEVWRAMPQTILFITHDVDEALILSERIYVMTAGRGCILEEVAVELPRPRTMEVMATPDFLAVKRKLLHLLERARAGRRPREILPACPAETDPLTGVT